MQVDFQNQANRKFLSEGREIFAWLDPAEVQKAMLAMIQLHFRGEIEHGSRAASISTYRFRSELFWCCWSAEPLNFGRGTLAAWQ